MRASLAALLLAVLAGLSACGKKGGTTKEDGLRRAYDSEPDWNDAQHIVALGYQEAQGKRIFYAQCVWCHADATPAGPSNRSNVTPTPPLMNDGAVLNAESDEYVQNIITLGGSAMGKSPMMPPYGRVLSEEDVRAVIAFTRAIAQPAYQIPARPGAKFPAK
ncbi:MAG TPA: cytochrome c [Candidatus Acidoferrales bacterium]|nr:cytochrome c [Candidatus Acidoferrales bacterium]